MKFSCTRDNLYTGLAITSHIPSKNVNLPILQNVLMVANNGNIRLTATNLEIAVSCFVRGKVEEQGELTIPSKLFFDYVSLLPNEKVDVRTEDQAVFVESETYKTKILGLPGSDFPLVPAVTAEQTFHVPAEAFRRALLQTLFSVATNESRPELSGVYVRLRGGKATFAATDSYRLAECTVDLGGASGGEASVIVPSRTMAELNRILSIFKDDMDPPTDVVVSLSENQIVFAFGTVELISRTIEGTYPDYQQIIPKSFQTEATVDREDFVKAVKTASLFSKTGLFDIAVSFDPSGSVTISAVDATRGENTVSSPARVSGQKNSVMLNYRYLLDGLQAMSSDEVVFQMIDGANPCLLKPTDKEAGYVYIVMPIRQ
jgi:DNA polymerase-3 subunit beta